MANNVRCSRSRVERIKPVALVGLMLASMAAAVACSDGGERFPAPAGVHMGEGGRAIRPPVPGPCTEGDTRDCRIVLGVQGAVTSCFDGVQECVDGGWGPCVDPTVADDSDHN